MRNRESFFRESILNTLFRGAAWAQTFMRPGGGTIPPGVTLYNQLGTATTTTDSSGNIVPAHNISANIDPATALTI